MKKEMTKKQMKEYLKNEINKRWEHVRSLRSMIESIDDNDKKVRDILVNDKYKEVEKADDLEDLLIIFFNENMYGEKVGE